MTGFTGRYGVSRAFVALAGVMALTACYRVRSELVPVPHPPNDVYRCAQLELGRAGYAIVGADRASGWLHAQKRIETLLDVRQAEIYLTVIPTDDDGRAEVQLTDNSHAEGDADRLRVSCLN